MLTFPLYLASSCNSGPPRFFFPLFFGFILLFIGIVVVALLTEKKRTKAFMLLSSKYGFRFEKNPADDIVKELNYFSLFKRGRSKKVYNVISMTKDNVSWKVFDYRYATGSGKNSSIHNQTVALQQIANLKLPFFSITPESFFHRIGDVFGYSDIDFEEYPEFSKNYFLKGSDEEEIRKLFSKDVIRYFEQEKNIINIEAAGDVILVYKPSKRIKPVELSSFMKKAEEVVSVFHKK